MVSILGDYEYHFPKPIELKYRLKDFLENEVDEKYYLSDKAIKYAFKRSEHFGRKPRINNVITHTLMASELLKGATQHIELVTDDFIKVPEDTKKGYSEAQDGDGVYINRPHQKRGTVQKGLIQTIKTTSDDIGVVVGAAQRGREGKQTLELNNEEVSNAITTVGKDSMAYENLRIRKLTPRECLRLMGLKDNQVDKMQAVQSNAQLYKQAGNSIVVNVLEAIFGEMME